MIFEFRLINVPIFLHFKHTVYLLFFLFKRFFLDKYKILPIKICLVCPSTFSFLNFGKLQSLA